MGTNLTITNHKTYVICNHTTRNTRIIKSSTKHKYFYTKIDYKWMKNNVEDLALVQNQELHETHLMQGSKIKVLEFFLEVNRM